MKMNEVFLSERKLKTFHLFYLRDIFYENFKPIRGFLAYVVLYLLRTMGLGW